MKSFEAQLRDARDLLREWLLHYGGQGRIGDYTVQGELERKTVEMLSTKGDPSGKKLGEELRKEEGK
jgi:hypothetical protein